MPATNDLIINCDGSAIGGRGNVVGCAGIVTYPDYCEMEDEEIQVSYNVGTCNDMEIFSIINCIKWVNKNKDKLRNLEVTRIIIYNDCQNVVDTCSNWIYKWVKNHWKKIDGGDIKNLSTWKDYYRERNKIPFSLEVHWSKGKGSDIKKKVDKLAKSANFKKTKKTNFGYVPVKQGSTLTKKKFQLEYFRATGQEVIIRVYYHTIINKTKGSNYEVRFEEVNNDFEIIGRYKALASGEIDRKIDRGHYYRARFNSNQKFPTIHSVDEITGNKLIEIKEGIYKLL